MARSTDTPQKTVDVNVTLRVDLDLLRRQKRALVGLQSSQIGAEKKEAIEGILNLLDFVQDQIVDQGQASEQAVFRFPSRTGATRRAP